MAKPKKAEEAQKPQSQQIKPETSVLNSRAWLLQHRPSDNMADMVRAKQQMELATCL